MALDITQLTKLSTAVGAVAGGAYPGVWMYLTPDTHATVIAANYFNNAASRLRLHDVILAVVGVGGTVQLRAYAVTAHNGTTVTVAQLVNS